MKPYVKAWSLNAGYESNCRLVFRSTKYPFLYNIIFAFSPLWDMLNETYR